MNTLLAEQYYNWLIGFVEDEYHSEEEYSDILEALFHFEFYEIIKNDCNRIGDGLALRNKFCSIAREHPYYLEEAGVPPYCSVLEMMIALARRIEDDIFYDPDEGDRTSKWFWIMVENLGLEDKNEDFDSEKTQKILEKFVGRKYEKSGQGGLFSVHKSGLDMREVEIWYQANYFFSEYLENFE